MCTLFSACGGSSGPPAPPDQTPDYSDFVFEGTDNSGKIAHSTVESLLGDGYVSDIIRANISDWLIDAYKNNPGIIDTIKDHSITQGGKEITQIMNDGWHRMSDGITSIENGVSDEKLGSSIQWNALKQGSYTDMDFIFGGVAGSVTDWSGYKYLWVYADVSNYGNDDAPLGIAFEEYDTEGGQIGQNRESRGLKEGGKATLFGSSRTDVSVLSSASANNANKGRIILPAGFKGWIRLALDDETFFPYWNYPTGNGTFDKKDVHQFILNLEGTGSSDGKSAFLGPFMLSGETDKVPETTKDEGFANVWNLNIMKANTTEPGKNDIVYVFYGEFSGKLLTGISYAYQCSPSEELKKAGDELAQALADAQYEDGYLGLFDGLKRYGGDANWDTWTQYHIIYGLLQWYRITGSQVAYDTMKKCADCAINFFRDNNRRYSYGTPMCNLAIAHAFASIYLENGEKIYLDTAEDIVLNQWKDCGDWLESIEHDREFYKMNKNNGNRWEPLHSLMTLAALYEATDNVRYRDGFIKLWQSIVKTDRRNTGSFSYGEEACGNMFDMSSGKAVETCCSVAWMALTADYLRLTLDSKAADELELSYYNTMLASLSEDNRRVTYDTPSDGQIILCQDERSTGWQTRSFSPDFTCCQASSGKGLNSISQWAVLNTENALYVNWYGSSAAKVKTPSGNSVTLTQETDYPVNGEIKFTVSGLENPEKFTLYLRVPSWATSFNVKIGDKEYSADKTGCYVPVTGTWENGMTFDLTIGMGFHYLVGQNGCAGKVSAYFGPVLLAADTNFNSSILDVSFTTEELEKSTVLKGENGTLLSVTVRTSGKEYKLISFGDVGTNGSKYKSWLNVRGNIENVSYSADGKPVWCAVSAE